MSKTVSTLEAKLQEKEQLVVALTQQLEQAAEQLDRVRRTGADRGVRVSGGIPAELVEEQKNLVEDLQRALQQWEDMQAGMTLGRIEMQISEVRDLIARELLNGGLAPRPHGRTEINPRESDAAQSNHRNGPPAAPQGTSPSGWEALKAGLLADDDRDDEDDAADPGDGSGPAQADCDDQPVELDTLAAVDAPEPIDFSAATAEELQHAVERRDDYILFLIKALRTVESRQIAAPDWTALNDAPDELRQQLQALEGRLEETLRTAEVELSLERARLGREATKLQHVQEQIQKEMKLLGLAPERKGQANGETPAVAIEPIKGRRWMRMLGLGPNGEPAGE